MILSKIAAFWNVFTVGMGIWALADCVASNKESIAYNYGEEFFTGFLNMSCIALRHDFYTVHFT